MQADNEHMSSRRGKARWTERPNQLKSLRRPLFPLLPRSTCWATSWLPAEHPVPPSCQWLAGDWSGIWPKHILPPFNLSLFPACQFWPIFPFPTHCTAKSSVDLRRGAACQLSQLTISLKLLPPPTTWSMLGWASSNQLPWAHPSPWSCSSSENHRGPFDKQWSDDWENKTSRRMMIRSPSSCGQWTQIRTIFWFSNRNQNQIERCLALGDEDLIKFCTRRLRLLLLSYSGEKIICK